MEQGGAEADVVESGRGRGRCSEVGRGQRERSWERQTQRSWERDKNR